MRLHRSERKYRNEDEEEHFNGRVPCSSMAHNFGFATAPEEGLPEGLSEVEVLDHFASFFGKTALSRPRWYQDQAASMQGPPPLIQPPSRLWPFSGASRLVAASTSRLRGPRLQHLLVDVALEPEKGMASCNAVLRLQALDLSGAELSEAVAVAQAHGASRLEHAGGGIEAHLDPRGVRRFGLCCRGVLGDLSAARRSCAHTMGSQLLATRVLRALTYEFPSF